MCKKTEDKERGSNLERVGGRREMSEEMEG